MRNAIFFLGLGLLLGGCSGGPDAKVTSDYLRTLEREFVKVSDNGRVLAVTCSVIVAPVKEVTKPLHLEARFDDDANPGTPLIANAVLGPGLKRLDVNSPQLRKLEKGKLYKAEIFIYEDREKSRRVGVHTQMVTARESL